MVFGTRVPPHQGIMRYLKISFLGKIQYDGGGEGDWSPARANIWSQLLKKKIKKKKIGKEIQYDLVKIQYDLVKIQYDLVKVQYDLVNFLI